MNKKELGIIIPYYKNSNECEMAFQRLMSKIDSNLPKETILFVYEDGQDSEWLCEYKKDNIIIIQNEVNKGVSYARNQGLNYLIDKVNYITFIDSDDNIDYDYFDKILKLCKENKYDIIETYMQVNEEEIEQYQQDKMRNSVCSFAFRNKIIGDNRFDETFKIREDIEFIKKVCDLSKHKKVLCDTYYYYQYGINPNSLCKLYIEKRKN